MPIFEVEHLGRTYEVDAPDARIAANALTRAPGPPPNPPETRPRAAVEAELAQREAAANEAQSNLDSIDWMREPARVVGRTAGALARGAVGLPGLVEQGITAPASYLLGQKVTGPVESFSNATRQPELAPKNDNEQYLDTATEFLGGVAGGSGIANTLEKIGSPIARGVGQALNESLGRQTAGAFTGATAVEDTRRGGGGPLAQTVAGLVGGGAAFVGAPSPTNVRAPVAPAAAAGDTVARLRANGFLVPPDVAKAKLALESPPGVQPSVPGHLVSGLVNRGPLHEAMTIENAKVIEGHLSNEFGLPPGTRATPQNLGALAHSLNAAWDMVTQAIPQLNLARVQSAFDSIGAARRDNPLLGELSKVRQFREQLAGTGQVTTQQAIDAIREWRADASRYFKATGGDAVQNDQIARAYRQAADALEDEIAAQLQATGNEHVYQQFENARTVQAKIHNVTDAWNGEHIDPQQLARLGDNGARLTGALADIADAARNAPDVVRSPTGSALASPSAGYGGHSTSVAESEIRRLLFDRWGIGHLMSPDLQNQYGPVVPRSPNTIAPPELPFGDPNVGPIFSNPDVGPPRPPEGPLPGAGSVAFEPTPGAPPGFPPAGDAPGLQPGASVGLADTLGMDPAGTANPWPEGPGRGAGGPSSQPPRAGGPVPSPGNLNIAPEDAHLLPTGLADLLQPQSTDVVPWLPPELQAIRDMDRAPPAPPPDPLAGLADLLAGVPEGPPRPLGPTRAKGAASGRAIKDALEAADEPKGQALADEFTPNGEPTPTVPGTVPPEVFMRQALAKADVDEWLNWIQNGRQGPSPAELDNMPNPRRADAEPFPRQPDIPLGDELTAEPTGPRPAAPDIAGGEPKYEPSPSAIVIENPNRRIVLEPEGDRLSIAYTEVDPQAQAQGLGQQNLVDAVYKAIRLRKPLDSGSSFTKSAWRAWKAALAKGVVEADNVPYDAIEAAFKKDPGVALNKGGQPWIRDIRLGPKAE